MAPKLFRQRSMSQPPDMAEAGPRNSIGEVEQVVGKVRARSQDRVATKPLPTPSVFKVCGCGDGGIEELRSQVDDAQVRWGLVRFSAGKGTLKRELLVAINFFGTSARPVLRANLGELKPCAVRVFGKVSAVIDLNHAEDVTRERLMDKLLIREESQEWKVSKTIQSRQMREEEPLEAPQEEEYAPKSGEDCLREILSEDGRWNWGLFGPDPEKMPLVAGGPDSVPGMTAALAAHPDEVLYGWVRLAFGDETRRQVRRVFVHWIGPGVSPTSRFEHSLVKPAILAKDKGWTVGIDLHAAKELSLAGILAFLKTKEDSAVFSAEEFERARQVGPRPELEQASEDGGDGTLLDEVARVRNGPLNWLLLEPAEDWKKQWDSYKLHSQSLAPQRSSAAAFPRGGRMSAPSHRLSVPSLRNF